MNDSVLFRHVFCAGGSDKMLLRLTGSTVYRVRLNGIFLAYGPARGPKGYFRIDEIPFCAADGSNVLEIEVSGANVNSYYYMDHASFLQAEVLRNDVVICWTGEHFKALDLTQERMQKAPRYCFQRMFQEVYSVTPERKELKELKQEVFPDFRYLARTVPLPDYKIDFSYKPVRTFRRRRLDCKVEHIARISEPREDFKCYSNGELAYDTFALLKQLTCDDQGPIISTLYCGKINNTGFIRLKVNCKVPGR
jgi:hypothetical protein